MSSSDDADDSASRDASYVTTFDPEAGDRASRAVVSAIAALTGADPTDVASLYDVLEPEALDALCAHAQRTGTATVHRLWFEYEGFDVCVRSDGQIRILGPTDDAASTRGKE
ncbi:HalOD1 output domain-containing protein [Halosolutus gelatinilyticus]|uniref:HalOD1 output domain-containing protein n=1 Tax=Halosolutus gelatinilyticus TaxID=2931975 RepID=UPI001FF69E64|nr:HalOD1 output domain-containing protein [Halosolutus gelatinilyticus]